MCRGHFSVMEKVYYSNPTHTTFEDKEMHGFFITSYTGDKLECRS